MVRKSDEVQNKVPFKKRKPSILAIEKFDIWRTQIMFSTLTAALPTQITKEPGGNKKI